MKPLKYIALIAALVAAPALAQTQPSPATNTCNASVVPDMVLGDYQIAAGPLQMLVAGNAIYPDPETTGTGKIYAGPLNEFMVQMTPPIPDFRLEETDRLQADWYWDALPTGNNAPGLYISSSDLELLTKCTIREMPRFIGTFRTLSQQGDPLDHTIRVVMALPDWLIGSWRFEATTANGVVRGLRYVIFDRTAP
ncbi:MAG: hypothetical protein DRI30_07770 [Chloroflexi bacterium]|nr:MAG: hypothetical protein DRI30_07770 [Chloroflexota bacterium]